MAKASKREEILAQSRARRSKSPDAFRTISEVAELLDVPQHVLRFWETKFNQIRPMKRGGGRRYYRPEDILLLRGISRLLYEDGFTIKGVQKLLKENGVRAVIDAVKEAPEEESLAPAVQGAANPADVVPFSGDHLPSEAKKVLRAALKDLEALKKDLTKPQ